MSTKPIREALNTTQNLIDNAPSHWSTVAAQESLDAALEAVRAIEEMARTYVSDDFKDDHNERLNRSKRLLESIAKEAP